jgi:hypothetical protein
LHTEGDHVHSLPAFPLSILLSFDYQLRKAHLLTIFTFHRQHLQKLRKKEDKGANGAVNGDGSDNIGTPKAKTPRKRATSATKGTGTGKRGRKAKADDYTDNDVDDDEEGTPSKKPKIEVKDE